MEPSFALKLFGVKILRRTNHAVHESPADGINETRKASFEESRPLTSSSNNPASLNPKSWLQWAGLRMIPAATASMAALAAAAPLTHGDAAARVGFLLVMTALLEMTHGFRRVSYDQQKSAWGSGAVSLALGVLLTNSPLFAEEALRLFLAAWFGLDGIRGLVSAIREKNADGFRARILLFALLNFLIAMLMFRLGEKWLMWAIALAASFRIFCTAWTMATSPLLTLETLISSGMLIYGFPDEQRMHDRAQQIAAEETARAAVDRGWVISFLLTLLAIHVGRMGFDRTFLGLMSPGFAVLGDMFAGLLIAFLIVIPIIVASNRLTRRLEGMLWLWCLSEGSVILCWPRRFIQSLLAFRIRQVIRLRLARCSFFNALSRGLQTGLPLAAIIAATAPMWGMSWYFDTENWAAGIWNSWAEHRTDTWRVAMVEAVSELQPQENPESRFAVSPEGVTSDSDFAFVVIGDPGEGDASQLSLKSRLLNVAERDDVQFVIISSDVVYPTGAMKDYEANFWLPFMGTTKPVYAIPGNHDWYDALEGFAATFFEPAAARAAMRARVVSDARITSTTDARIEQLIAQASRLQQEYGVPTQLQKAPFFQLQTDTFALFAVDTGVARQVDPVQFDWLKAALEAANGKTKMVILGHPFFAGGVDQTTQVDLTAEPTRFAELRNLLRQHNVSIVMAGDTHDLEYYKENRENVEPAAVVHHFVNGGGGAYLSFGTALDWPKSPVTEEWAFFPNRDQVVTKIEATTPLWKRPAWIWTKRLGGWPFSAEFLSAAFDSNQAPFYQSFMEVRVEPSKNQVRLIPYGVHGQLRYRDMQMSAAFSSSDTDSEAVVEWIVPMLPVQ